MPLVDTSPHVRASVLACDDAGTLKFTLIVQRMRNLAIAIFKLTGTRNIAAACRRHARDATRVLATLGLAPLCPKRT